MSAYRYVVFPQGKQPTVDEVAELKGFAAALGNHFAYGTCRRDGRLAIAFEQSSFDQLKSIDAGFQSLVFRWEARGCELLAHLAFVKDSKALRPVAAPPVRGHSGAASADGLSQQLAGKQAAAQEAVARSLLSVEQTLERYAAVGRLAAAAPYLMMVAAIAMIIAAGAYIHHRLQDAERDSRQEAIERALDDPLQEPRAIPQPK
ncbi:MAG: hypothetical protein DCC67_09275 [Planctomycetota bacterium]|nr:MAG: hypothetical protein DCC67_09275 [Planctomycetota bacterium]